MARWLRGATVDVLAQLRRAGVARGDLVGLAAGPGTGIGLAAAGRRWPVPPGGEDAVRLIDAELRPRWGCLHDELLVHTPAGQGAATARLVDECLHEAARRWAPGSSVRFISDTSVVPRWSDAKAGTAAADEPPG